MSVRLSNKLRNEILNSVIGDKIKKKALEITTSFGDRISKNFKRYPPKVQKWIDEAPSGMLVGHTRFSISKVDASGGKFSFKHKILVDESYQNRCFTPAFAFSSKKSIFVPATSYDADITLKSKKDIADFDSTMKSLNDLTETKARVVSTVKKALWGCNTTKQLKENYPELAQYIPEPEKASTSIMIPNEDVTDALDQINSIK